MLRLLSKLPLRRGSGGISLRLEDTLNHFTGFITPSHLLLHTTLFALLLVLARVLGSVNSWPEELLVIINLLFSYLRLDSFMLIIIQESLNCAILLDFLSRNIFLLGVVNYFQILLFHSLQDLLNLDTRIICDLLIWTHPSKSLSIKSFLIKTTVQR